MKPNTIKRIRQILEERKLPISQLSKKCGWDRTNLYRYLAKKNPEPMGVSVLDTICKALGCSWEVVIKEPEE